MEANFSVVDIPCSGPPEDDHLVTYRITLFVFIIGFLCLFGVIGNAVSIVVLRQERDKENTTYWLLQTLAVADTLYLLAAMFIFTLQTIAEDTDWWPALTRTYPLIKPYAWPCGSVTQTITVWIIVLITIHRYIAVTRPFHARSSNPRYIKIAALLVYITAVLYNTSTFLERRSVPCNNGTQYTTIKTELRVNTAYFIVFHLVLHSIFKTLGPLLLLLVLTVGLIKHLRKARKAQESMTGNAAHSNNITFMLITVVTVFIVCEIPDTICRIVYIIWLAAPDAISFPFVKYSNMATNALQVLNSAVNFIIYGFTGTQFRNDLKKLCCRPRADSDADDAILTMDTFTNGRTYRRSLPYT